ncbi:virion protein [uncultured Caudovirales phage]|uniref:Virion protein n=1 Tax=uncultured Caudovirales phage TaxID=2100421 RepID=A0A6J5SDR1_9CAUD|nr:virion protein [uncultured Caudovirales phage]CAB4211948.1 virion protein [uncultured Caudovirales phage]
MSATSNNRPPVSWRNNNPGNIRFVPSIKWQGQEGEGDGGFAKFKTPEFGFRALARQLMTYKERYGLDTLRKILNRWAPPNGFANGKSYEQNTSGYIEKVSKDMGVHPDDPLNVQNAATMLALVKAIADYEDGAGWKWPDHQMVEGLRLAGFDVPPVPVYQTGTVRTAAKVGAAGVAVQGIGPLTEGIAQAVPAMSVLKDLAPWLAALIVVLVAGWFVWERIQKHRRDAP